MVTNRRGDQDRVPDDWKLMPLGAVLQRLAIPVEVQPTARYREIGIRSHGKGVFHKDEVAGASIGDKRVFEVVPGALAMNIVFAWEGSVAVMSERERGMIASHRFPMFVPSGQVAVDVEFVRRFFQTELGVRLLGNASPGGAGRNRTLNQKFAAEIPIPIPPLGEQRKIVTILSAVDDAIEATQAVIDQLQAVKKAMMAELLTRGLPGRHVRFKQTEIGEIPEGWHLIQLRDLLVDGPTNGLYKPANKIGRGTLVAGMTAIEGATLNWAACRRAELDVSEIARFGMQPGDLLVTRVYARVDGIGRFIVVPTMDEAAGYESNMMRLRVDSERALPDFVAVHMTLPELRREIEQRATLGAQASINNEGVRGLPVRLPPLDEQRSLVAILDSFDARAKTEARGLTGLVNLKSALMSVLLTGEVRVTPDEGMA